ncbi:Zinc-finger domain of monoamine-oxidase A repressor R1 [Arabidopsis thaliana x Arabidopsis arenosa]|uniref:Zinc-finger domain of monoamine-oxidase A repressor R1 n=1 Tax=Arabidopsis thaliana x Arabidopsis arenosa TaxID=1240361 RepID=A0A8T1YCY8_9BRAS|nr:Zinc-finger domain of monoamine-oxidase A repressor R1 [Arabidopsis thaliana x Arabidopsis arenosa]
MAVVSKNQTQQQTPNPGGGESRIEDSTIGKTCHQCRQKRTDLVGSCVTKKKDKTCPIKLCTKCILNRYGENAEEVALKKDWMCPKCRGNCNCSYCMKKRGQKPTGILVHTAKKTGFSSVSELLKTSGSDKYFYTKKVKPEGGVVALPLKLDQENSIEQKRVSIKKSRKTKREELKDLNNGCSDENAVVKKSSPKKIKISDSVHATEVTKKVLAEGKKKKTTAKDIKENNVADKTKRIKHALKKKEEDQVEVKLPQGNSSITVSGIDLAPEDAGNVFQFLEFCSAFGKALDLRKGQAECVIREMLSGRSKRRQQYSTLTQMIIQLLTVILEDKGETSVFLSATDASWFTTIGECLSESEVKLDDFPPEMFEKGLSQYEKLNSSKRLKLLNFLCDETLGTSVMRNCIDSQNIESVERKKEAKEKINAAKDKEKQLKQKLQDELAQAVKEKNGIPLLITEHDAIVTRINAETKEVYSEMQNAIDMLSKKSQGSDDAVRTNPVELDDNGLIFWRLKSYNDEPNILLQDLGSWNEVCPHEKWFSFNSEQKPEIEKYISSIRMKRLGAQKNANTIIT